MLCLGPIGMLCVISESCFKGTILQRSYYGKYHSFVKFHGKKFGSHMTLLYLNPCYKTRCVIKVPHRINPEKFFSAYCIDQLLV